MKKKTVKTAKKAAKKAAPRKLKAAPEAPSVFEVPEDAAGLRAAIDVIADPAKPAPERASAIQSVQAASFSVLEFDSVRADYTAALRKASGDTDPELRQRALGLLARDNDGYAQKVLLDGLKDEKKALLPTEKALQLLSYNPHNGVYPVARKLLTDTGNQDVKREAIRLLAGDPESAKTIEKTLADKAQTPEIRRMSAAALHALNPQSLQNWASKALLDKTEHQDVVAACLSAINQFGDAKALTGDKALQKRMDELTTNGPAKVKSLAKQFMMKYGK